jgi:hypothetical protein
MGFGFVTEFMEILQLVTTIYSSYITLSLSHTHTHTHTHKRLAIPYNAYLMQSVSSIFTILTATVSNGRCSTFSGPQNCRSTSATATLDCLTNSI